MEDSLLVTLCPCDTHCTSRINMLWQIVEVCTSLMTGLLKLPSQTKLQSTGKPKLCGVWWMGTGGHPKTSVLCQASSHNQCLQLIGLTQILNSERSDTINVCMFWYTGYAASSRRAIAPFDPSHSLISVFLTVIVMINVSLTCSSCAGFGRWDRQPHQDGHLGSG